MDDRVSMAAELMVRFAERTGITSERPGRRYLWTDAFAVCNFLGLAHVTGDGSHEALALRLVAHVHEELGRYRADDRRRGWLSGLPDAKRESIRRVAACASASRCPNARRRSRSIRISNGIGTVSTSTT